jgi:cytochrome c peroxidase
MIRRSSFFTALSQGLDGSNAPGDKRRSRPVQAAFFIGRRTGAILGLSLASVLAACGGASDTGSSAQPQASVLDLSESAVNYKTLSREKIEPLGSVSVPDVNVLGLLDKSGPSAAAWPKITNVGQKVLMQSLGKALFWDMQVGSDGITACASCHFNAGADNRVNNQVSPGHKPGEVTTELTPVNSTLNRTHFSGTVNGKANAGLAVNQAGLIDAGYLRDAANGTPGALGRNAINDINDVVSSQGVLPGQFDGLSGLRQDFGILDATSAKGFNTTYSAPNADTPNTVRQVPGRNSPSNLNAVFYLRGFWDGRANMFFNGVNHQGVNDPAARVKTFVGGVIKDERLDIPFSSLASQAVEPIDSSVEMAYRMRPNAALGKKLIAAGAKPLDGQAIAADDSLLASLRDPSGRGLKTGYASLIKTAFDQRFWGDGTGKDVCVSAQGVREQANLVTGACPTYTLMQYNFPLFFGLSVQAYEATLVSGQTIVDLIAGGVATGNVTVGAFRLDVTGMALSGCFQALPQVSKTITSDSAKNACLAHYAKFIHPSAVSGSESGVAQNRVAPGTPIGGCATPLTCAASPNLAAARATLSNIQDGLNRFYSGDMKCSTCHSNPEFSSATVTSLTKFSAAMSALPNGQVRATLDLRQPLERHNIFTTDKAIVDWGFFNIGVRPTGEDLALGDANDGVPLSLGSIINIQKGGAAGSLDSTKTKQTAQLLLTGVKIPLSPTNLTPQAFPIAVGCKDAGTTVGCNTAVVPNERLMNKGAFKTPGLRNVKFTGPYMHNGGKMDLRQVMEFYKTAGNFDQLNGHNMSTNMRVISIAGSELANVIEMMETGLTDWRVAVKQGPFDHPELCLPNGHDPVTGKSRIVGLPAVGKTGAGKVIATFTEVLDANPAVLSQRANSMLDACTLPGLTEVTISAATAAASRTIR